MSLAHAPARALERRAKAARRKADTRAGALQDELRRERFEIAAGIQETIALERARGEVFAGKEPFRRLDPLALLLRDGFITRTEAEAGDIYGNLYRELYDCKRTRAHWRDGFIDSIEHALKLRRARQDGLKGDPELIFLADQICGRQIRPTAIWGARHHQWVAERLRVVLYGLGRHYGLIWWEDDVDRA